jgi:hypothetical protein
MNPMSSYLNLATSQTLKAIFFPAYWYDQKPPPPPKKVHLFRTGCLQYAVLPVCLSRCKCPEKNGKIVFKKAGKQATGVKKINLLILRRVEINKKVHVD